MSPSRSPDNPDQPVDGVTMRQVADKAGVSIGTVSLALRNHRSISKKTSQRIQELALKMGYRPNPLVSALMARLHRRRKKNESPTLALILESEKPPLLEVVPFYSTLFAGLRERAKELGYTLETFLLESRPTAGARLHRILHSRNVRGVILGPVFHPSGELSLPLEGLASCSLGDSIHKPLVHRIGTNYAHAIKLAWTELTRRGYRRPGFIHTRAQLERLDYSLLGTFLCLQRIYPDQGAVPPLVLENSPDQETNQCVDEIVHWYRKYRPDVLLFLPWKLVYELRRKIRIPQDAGAILFDEEPGWTQVQQMPRQIGYGAVDWVVAQIHRNETGVPLFPRTTSINCSWIEGDTLPIRRLPKGKSLMPTIETLFQSTLLQNPHP